MNIERNGNQPLNGNRYLSTMAKHEDSEQKMGERIQLTYKEAMAGFNYCINSHEKIGRAFQNFKNVQDNEISKFPLDQDILILTALDKFKSELYFLVKNAEQDSLSHYGFNATTRQFTTLSEIKEFERENLLSGSCFISGHVDVTLSPNIKYVSFLADVQKIEELWSKGLLNHLIQNPSVNTTEINENQPYMSDFDYTTIEKSFNSIDEPRYSGTKEMNKLDHGRMYSYFNPAHTLLLPADVINFIQNQNLTKSSRSAI